jgi:hypothetical protein
VTVEVAVVPNVMKRKKEEELRHKSKWQQRSILTGQRALWIVNIFTSLS